MSNGPKSGDRAETAPTGVPCSPEIERAAKWIGCSPDEGARRPDVIALAWQFDEARREGWTAREARQRRPTATDNHADASPFAHRRQYANSPCPSQECDVCRATFGDRPSTSLAAELSFLRQQNDEYRARLEDSVRESAEAKLFAPGTVLATLESLRAELVKRNERIAELERDRERATGTRAATWLREQGAPLLFARDVVARAFGWRDWAQVEHDAQRDGYTEAGGRGRLAASIGQTAREAQDLIEHVERFGPAAEKAYVDPGAPIRRDGPKEVT